MSATGDPSTPTRSSSPQLTSFGDTAKAFDDLNKALELAPENASVSYNSIAWALVTCADTSFWDPARAIELATKAVELSPGDASFLNTFGVLYYRDGDYRAAIKHLAKSVELDRNAEGLATNGLFLAMAHWRSRRCSPVVWKSSEGDE